ncbi:hypothetical protein [Halococcus saccharolyticus]|uniref:hypothetical protein n=1 Tax=Halococcus saccharolyticus TaxID=62319 RepID=UPI0006781CE4|nr:hypothetical protein [Halococcus saccharolyticus]
MTSDDPRMEIEHGPLTVTLSGPMDGIEKVVNQVVVLGPDRLLKPELTARYRNMGEEFGVGVEIND